MLERVVGDAKGFGQKNVSTAKRLPHAQPVPQPGNLRIKLSAKWQTKDCLAGHKKSRFCQATALKSKSNDSVCLLPDREQSDFK
jgi:hypothetical protein